MLCEFARQSESADSMKNKIKLKYQSWNLQVVTTVLLVPHAKEYLMVMVIWSPVVIG